MDESSGVAFETSGPATSRATDSDTSLPASASGATRFGSRAFQMSFPFGPEAVRVSRSRSPASAALAKTTSATSGPSGSGSSASAALQSSLESRLRAAMGSTGSTLFALTWRERATPSGRRICALRVSGRLMSDSDSSSWPTPAARDWRDLSMRGAGYAAQRARHQPSAVTTSYLRGFGYTQVRFLLSRLMGLPDQWVLSAPSATRLSRR